MIGTGRLGTKGYAELLLGLHRKPATSQELSARHGVDPRNMVYITRRMHGLKLVHIHGWHQPCKGQARPIFGFGNAPDAPRPLRLKTGKPSTAVMAPPPKPAIDLVTFAHVMYALAEKRTVAEVQELSGGFIEALRRHIQHMHAIGLVHIAGWERRPYYGPPTPLYRVGIGRADAPRPLPMSKKESNARYRAKQRERAAYTQLARALASNASVFNQAA